MGTSVSVDSPQIENVSSRKPSEPAVELKGSVFTLPVLRVSSADLRAIEKDLSERLAQAVMFFQNAPIVIDLERVGHPSSALDLVGLVAVLRDKKLIPVGVRNAAPHQAEAAVAAGLAVLRGGSPPKAAPEPVVAVAPKPPAPAVRETKFVTQAVRSGQKIHAPHGDLVVLAQVNAGAEIVASGNIHVYGALRGRALAGVSGDTSARIVCQQMEAELVAIAGQFRVFEDIIPGDIFGKLTQIYLNGEKLVIEPVV